jgi:hypothetical protein
MQGALEEEEYEVLVESRLVILEWLAERDA